MAGIKGDMAGAAAVTAAVHAAAVRKLKVNITACLPLSENRISQSALLPGDVITGYSGKTIEVLNTDAEGRLVLSDAVSYGIRKEGITKVLDIATLTGACVVALGGVHSGLFSPSEPLAAALLAAGASAHDSCWRMPLDDEYAEGLKSNFADVGNVGGRAGGAVSAAKFLQRFATQYPWAHLDIAGTAWKSGAAKGSTGRPVGLLLDYLVAQQASAPAAAPRKPARKAVASAARAPRKTKATPAAAA